MVQLKDIAKACGVSEATVSKALNDKKDVSEKSKEIIRKKANEMGYRPNKAARALRTKRTNNIGIITGYEINDSFDYDYYVRIIDHFRNNVEKKGYNISFVNPTDDYISNNSYPEYTLHQNYAGILIVGNSFDTLYIHRMVNNWMPKVLIDFISVYGISVSSDHAQGMVELVNYAYKQGHRKIAYIYNNRTPAAMARLSSFYQTGECLGLNVPEEYMINVNYRGDGEIDKAIRNLIALPEPPTCIFCPDDQAALEAMLALNHMGLSVGKDISLAGYGGIDLGKRIQPQLTTTCLDTEMIGKTAADNLLSFIEKPKTTLIQHINLEGKLHKGGTIQKIAERVDIV